MNERRNEILPIRRQIVRQSFPTQGVDDGVRREGTGALLAVRQEGLARLGHACDGVLRRAVLGSDELVARDGAGVVVRVGFLEVFGWLGVLAVEFALFFTSSFFLVFRLGRREKRRRRRR